MIYMKHSADNPPPFLEEFLPFSCTLLFYYDTIVIGDLIDISKKKILSDL